jgi:hypothetical protein
MKPVHGSSLEGDILKLYFHLTICIFMAISLVRCTAEEMQHEASREASPPRKDASRNGTLNFGSHSILSVSSGYSLYSRMEIHESNAAAETDTVTFSLAGSGVNLSGKSEPYQLSFVLSDTIQGNNGGVFSDSTYALGTVGAVSGLLNMVTLSCASGTTGQCREYQSVAGTVTLLAAGNRFSGAIRASMARTENGLDGAPEFDLIATFESPDVTQLCFVLSPGGLDPAHFQPTTELPDVEVTVPVSNEHPFCTKYLEP